MGRVKTRLAREIGWAEATRFARIAARSTIQRLARDRRWRVLLAVAPDMATTSRVWPARVRRTGQGAGDLGERMARLLVAHRPALLIGADIPAVSVPVIAEGFGMLRRNDVVLGPAEDGGYWLVGLHRMAPRHDWFRGVRWSSPSALADTVASFGPLRIAYGAMLSDVDDADSHRRWGALAGRIVLPGAVDSRRPGANLGGDQERRQAGSPAGAKPFFRDLAPI